MGVVQQRLTPQNLEAEQSVLAAMLISKEALYTGLASLRPEHFYKDSHRIIFQAIQGLDEQSQPVDIVTVSNYLNEQRKLEDVGGPAYLTDLNMLGVLVGNTEAYSKIVKEKALLRHLIAMSQRIADRSYSDDSYEDIIGSAEQEFLDIGKASDSRAYDNIRDVARETFAQIEAAYRNKGKITGLRTAYVDFDHKTNGLQNSDLIILAARPGMGKSALALNISQNIALRENTGVLFFSLEMPSVQLVHRMICSESRIDSQNVRKGFISDSELIKINDAVAKLEKAPIYIDDTPGISITELRSKARRIKLEHDIGFIVIDYLQLITASGFATSRQQEIAYITRQVKELARELDIPIMALAQLNRQVESRADKRPMMSDLRESGELEQTADLVIFIYRDDYYNKESEKQNITELLIRKHRNGPTGDIELVFNNNFGRFDNAERREMNV